MSNNYLKMILNSRVYDVASKTPLDFAKNLSRRLANDNWLKREDLQPVFSFKLRGAYNKIARLAEAECANGIIAASAGNHAQGVALAAQHRNIKALIVMPRTTPGIKVEAVKTLGGKTLLHGDTYDEAYAHALQLAEQRRMVFIHPYDDPEVIAGQGTIAMELLQQHRDGLNAVFVPVGGGGLIAGIAAYIKALRPDIRVIGVEPDDAPCMYEALKRKRRVVLDQVGIFVDGVAVRQAGKEPYRLARKYVDEVILVSTDEICAEPGIVGIMKVVREAYPDHTAFNPEEKYYDPKSDADNPRWYMVDVQYQRNTKRVITLAELKGYQQLEDCPLVRKGNRLSIMPFSKAQWDFVLELENC